MLPLPNRVPCLNGVQAKWLHNSLAIKQIGPSMRGLFFDPGQLVSAYACKKVQDIAGTEKKKEKCGAFLLFRFGGRIASLLDYPPSF